MNDSMVLNLHSEAERIEESCSIAAFCPAHAISDSAAVLAEIANPEVNLALWQRPIDPTIARETARLKADDLPDRRRSVSLQSFDADVYNLFLQQSLDPDHFSHLRQDMNRLAMHLAEVSGCQNFIYRLATTTEDECRRFHLDSTPLRLICSYQGPGTEWLPDPQVDRCALANGAANDAIIRYGQAAHFQTFWAGILRGRSSQAAQGLVHRSPSIEGTGLIRVLFCLDCEC